MNSAPAEVRVVPFEPGHTEAVLELMRKWSPDHPELAERSLIEWQRCARYVALAGDRVVGQICQVPHEFRYADQRPAVRVGWGITLVLDMSDDAIRKAAGRQLLATCETAEGLKYGAVGVVPIIEPAYIRRGHRLTRDSSAYFARFFKPAKALAYWQKPTWLAPGLHAANLLQPARTGSSAKLERITRFDAAWDGTWDRLLRARYEFAGTRTADYLNYKLAQPRREYHAYVHRAADGVPDGYVVFRRARHLTRDLDVVKICDFVAHDGNVDALLAAAMRFAQDERRTGTYGIVGLSAMVDAAAMRRAGLWVRRPSPVVLAGGVEGAVRVSFFDSDLDDLW
ncbi:MAG TPA: hypothetical protein PLY94_08795 [Gemmatimonadaceae bacterium]|nr:hypothetical protein [Gemmatimonadaceae bacterium]